VNARIVRRLLWLAGFACLCAPVLDDPPLQTGAYLLDVTPEAATVAMITAEPASLSCVVRRADGTVAAKVDGVPDRRRHRLRVQGLQPGIEYRYTLEAGSDTVAAGRLSTPPADDRAAVRFAFLGDSGAQPWWVWMQKAPLFHLPARWRWLPDSANVTAIGAQVAAYRPDFLLHLGDIIYPYGRHAHYTTGFFGPFADVVRDAPVYAILGNHDLVDAGGLQALANLGGLRGDATGDARCFSFAWGSVRVIGLDCDADRVDGHYDETHPAHGFLVRQLERCAEPWIVVGTHFPIRSASRQRNRGDLMLTLLPTLQQHQVSVYLSGHDHCYQRFGPGDGGMPLIVSGGGGKSLYEVRPEPGAILKSAYHWCSAEANGATLQLRAHGIDGSEIDALALRLPEGERLEQLRRQNPARAARIQALLR
jgi:hypothetical protein